MNTIGFDTENADIDDVAGYVTAMRSALSALSIPSVREVLAELERAYAQGRTIFLCGNGGSAATASHLAVDLSKGARCPGARPIRTISLVDHVAAVTAWANDEGYHTVFAAQLAGLASPGDVVLAITTSGNSPNVVEALRYAREIGMVTVSLLGPTGGQARPLSDVYVLAPGRSIEQQEDLHAVLAHAITRHMRQVVRAASPLAATAQRLTSCPQSAMDQPVVRRLPQVSPDLSNL